MTPDKRKETLKRRFGDRYLEFMTDLNNVAMSHADIAMKWEIDRSLISRYVDDLGYSHTGRIKQNLRTTYAIQKRIRQRQETARQMMRLFQRRGV